MEVIGGTEVTPEVVTVEETVLPSDTVEFEMPEKFAGKTAEEIAKSYIELEKFKASKEEIPPVENGTKPSLDTVQELIADGLDDEKYAELEKQGYSKEQVDIYKAGLDAQFKAEGEKILTSIGTSEAEYNQAAEYMQKNWDPARLERFNTAVTNASAEVLPTLLETALLEYRQASGSKGPILETQSIGKSDGKVKGYTDNAEFYKDMADPRYGRDAKFMAAVEAKMEASGDIF